MDRFYILRQDEFKHILPTREEVKKFGKIIEHSDHAGLDTESVERKAREALKYAGKLNPKSKRFIEGLTKGL